MTLTELERDVLSLMFETQFENKYAFIGAANRALNTIHTDRERTSTTYIYKKNYKPTTYIERIVHKPNEVISVEVSGKSLSFISFGMGEYILRDGEAERSGRFSGNHLVISEFINTGAATIEFHGLYDYDIHSLAAFEEKLSANKYEIEVMERIKAYDMREKDPLFLAFAKLPEDRDGNPILSVVCEGSILKIPSAYEGEIKITYKRRHTPITIADIDTVVDVAEECEHLLALLIASYLLLDDNEALAQYYMSLYRDGMTSVKVYNKTNFDAGYKDVLGWAK